MNWATSPVCTEIEMRVLDWLVDLLGLPQSWKMDGPGGGVIQMSASDATHVALVVARERARARGASIDDQVVYGSAQVHSSIEKGARIAGFVNIRQIDTDDSHALDVSALRRAIDADVKADLKPTAVVSSLGTTSTTAVDLIREIGEIASEYSMWHRRSG